LKIGESFDLQPYQNSLTLFFTGRKLHPPGIGIEATGFPVHHKLVLILLHTI